MKSVSRFLPSVEPLAERFDAFILDLWGVIHDGQHAYPNVHGCLEVLRKKNKKIIFLSNAPRRAQAVKEVLDRMGIEENLYDKIVTSGETAYQCLSDPESPFFRPRGKNYFYIGLEKDRRILEGLPFTEVQNPEHAHFLLLAHSYTDNQPLAELLPLFDRCLAQHLPAVCINPDSEVVRLGGERVYCAGALAEKYKELGGEVIYFGKPHRAVYEACLREFGSMDTSRIVAVGDNLATDMEGAQRMGLASALVTGGLLHETVGDATGKDYEAKCKAVLSAAGCTPDFIVPTFNW